MRHTRERRSKNRDLRNWEEILNSWTWNRSGDWDPNEWEDTESTWIEKFTWSKGGFE